MSKSSKLFGSLLNSVINHIGDGIKNLIDNAEISQELNQNGEDGKKTYSIHFNIGNKQNFLDIEVEHKDFYIKNSTLISYQGQENNVIIPDTVNTIGDNAFKNSKLFSITIPDSVTSIGANAFSDCINLETVQFGKNIKNINKSAFENCYMLQTIELPESLEFIGDRCFAENWNLHRVILPFNLESLPNELFIGCRSLEYIKWPNCLKQWGNNIFAECIEPDLWQYFIVENGECHRINAIPNELDPDGVLALDVSYYSMIQSRKLLNWVWKDFPFDPDLVQSRMKFCKKALYFSACISDCDVYAALQTIDLCYQMLNISSSHSSNLSLQMMHQILNTIAGNGEAWKKSDVNIKNSILSEEDMNDPLVHSIAEKAFTSMMAEMNTPLTSHRYHPGIFHFAAEYLEQQGYWDFALKLEGLLRFEDYNITACRPECDTGDSLDEWICTWSKLNEVHETAIVLLSLCNEQRQPVKWFSIMPRERAESLREFLEEENCQDILDGWINGEKLFALRLI